MYLLNLDSFLGAIDPIYKTIDFKLYDIHACLYVKRIYYYFLHHNIIVLFLFYYYLLLKNELKHSEARRILSNVTI